MEKKIRGSSTACIISYDHEKKILSSANLGDSGFVIIRNGKIAFQSEETLVYFFFPSQRKRNNCNNFFFFFKKKSTVLMHLINYHHQ